MKKIFLGWMTVALLLGGGSIAFADDESNTKGVSGVNNGTIAVNGTLGADNRSRKATIEEGHDDWINVTLPVTTIFYSMQDATTIKSPTYTITNKSGRRVKVSLQSFTHEANSAAFDDIDHLDLKLSDTVTFPLISNVGGVATLTADKPEIAILDPGADVDNGETAVPEGAKFTYVYAGATKTALTTQSQPNFTLALKFAALPKETKAAPQQ